MRLTVLLSVPPYACLRVCEVCVCVCGCVHFSVPNCSPIRSPYACLNACVMCVCVCVCVCARERERESEGAKDKGRELDTVKGNERYLERYLKAVTRHSICRDNNIAMLTFGFGSAERSP